jgi:MoaA/NifB/PqqE/SkfB family radical SAM enzyme
MTEEGVHSANDAARFDLLASMPMRFNGLVVETTNRCNAKCAMCYQSAGPKGSDVLGPGRLELPVLERLVREAIEIPALNPRLHLAGGEAFLQLEDVLHLFEVARDVGYLDLTGTTNGFWARKLARANDVASRLRDAGVTSMELSWDFWHAPFVKAEAVSNSLLALASVGIETNLRVLTTRSHSIGEALALLDSDAVASAHRITTGPVFRTGRAAQQIPSDEFFASEGYGGACHGILNLTVNSLGDVFPCCAGSDQTRDLKLGNVKDESIAVIAARMNRDPIVRLLVFGGAASLLPILKQRGLDLGDEFDSMCHLCWTVLSDARAVELLRRHAEDAAVRSLERVAAALEA